MAKVTIAGETFSLDENDITNREAMAIESATGVTFGEFGELLKKGSALALTALVWILKRRANPSLKFGDVDFKFGELELGDDAETDADAEGSSPKE